MLGHRLDRQQGSRLCGYHMWLKVRVYAVHSADGTCGNGVEDGVHHNYGNTTKWKYANVIYLEFFIGEDRGVRKLFSGKKGKTSLP